MSDDKFIEITDVELIEEIFKVEKCSFDDSYCNGYREGCEKYFEPICCAICWHHKLHTRMWKKP
jgi:hypothetical protein